MTFEENAEQRFLILHDYGMGDSWWWVRARSAREVLETFAEVEVIEAPEAIERAEGWNLDEADVDAPTMPAGLGRLYAQRQAHRHLPGFGALADRTIVYLRRRWDGNDGVDPADYLMEIGSDGRRLRQVEVTDDGDIFKSDPDDWSFNPPLGYFDSPLGPEWWLLAAISTTSNVERRPRLPPRTRRPAPSQPRAESCAALTRDDPGWPYSTVAAQGRCPAVASALLSS